MTKLSTEKLGEIPETMLITLWAKSEESKFKEPFLIDKRAEEIIWKIDYDFTKFKKSKFSQAGICLRASLIDREVREFIEKNPDAVVIQLWSGLDARFERIGSPEITHWYDLDLPEVIELRKELLKETEKNTFLDFSLFDYKWIDTVLAHNKPVLIIVEWVLMYFQETDVKAFFAEICNCFEKTTVIFDMLAYSLVWKAKVHDAVKWMKDKPEFTWSVLNTKEMEKWNPKIHLWKEYIMSDYNRGRYPFIFRVLYHIPYFYKRFNQKVVKLEIN